MSVQAGLVSTYMRIGATLHLNGNVFFTHCDNSFPITLGRKTARSNWKPSLLGKTNTNGKQHMVSYTPPVPLHSSCVGNCSIVFLFCCSFLKNQARNNQVFSLLRIEMQGMEVCSLFSPSLICSLFFIGIWHGLHIPYLSCYSENVLWS